ncbi:hypothetical protein [Pedobacter gandavensis]|uniref:hypothetical protein n=1 Tax=Pedobacter gandavensis TaxID=2679963 RepID=UPI00292D271F|nr:hypothetical protein [Pedobacter gandavensis]
MIKGLPTVSRINVLVGSICYGNDISEITYNYLNLPSSLTAGGKLIQYRYDVAGQKLSKSVAAVLSNEYIRGIQYENGILKYLQSPEGRVVRNSSTSYNYEYTLADHLGNGRL